MAPVTTLKGAVEPILWLNRIFCMGIFEIPANRPRVVLSVIYVISMFIGYFILLYKTVYAYVHTSKVNDVFLLFCVVGVNIFVASVAIILYWCKCKNLLIIIKKIGHVDDTLETLGVHHDYQKTFRSVATLLFCFVTIMLLMTVMEILWTYNKIDSIEILILTNLCFCLPIMVNFVVDITFISFILCLKKKFQYTNYLVNNVVLCANESNVFKISRDKRENTSVGIIKAQYGNNKNDIMHLVQTLRQLHLELTTITRQVNSTFCFQLLLELAVHFTAVTTSVYNLYAIFTGKTQVPQVENIIVSTIIWGGIYAFKVVLVNNLCTRTSEEAYKTGEIIQSFVKSAIDDDVRGEINQFTQQIMLTSLKFTAVGFFTIDNSLTGKFFATVTTYVVILIEMNTPI